MIGQQDKLILRAGLLELECFASRGGGITRFEHDGEPLFIGRSADPTPLGLACFPLVPFSNRIANGRFQVGGRNFRLPRNHPSDLQHPHVLHGFGWQLPWTIIAAGPEYCHLGIEVDAGAWPWRWQAEQWLTLSPNGLTHRIRVVNADGTSMPAGIGLHPWFPRNDRTRFESRHLGEWQTAPDGLPLRLQTANRAVDWWLGAPVASRIVDTVYIGRDGNMAIDWPDRSLHLVVTPSDTLGFTVVYVPEAADYFCVEPVSHMTDAINRPEAASVTGLRWLNPGESLSGEVVYSVSVTGAQRQS